MYSNRKVEDGNSIRYYVDGWLHREDGPALVYINGSENWYLYGKRHRIDGPALVCSGGMIWWYINGISVHSAERFQLLSGISDEQLSMLVLKYGPIT